MPAMSSRNWTLREITMVFFRHWKMISTLVVLSMIGLAAMLFYYPDTYESEAKLFVRLGRENVGLDSTVSTGQTVSLNASREADINSLIEHLESRSIIEKVFEQLSQDETFATPREREIAISSLAKKVTISSPRSSYVIRVSCKGETPELAQQTLDAILATFRDEHMRVTRSRGSFEFFDSQTQDLQEQLEKANFELRDAKNSYHLASYEGRRRGLEDELARVDRAVAESRTELAASEAKMVALKENLSQLPESLVRQMVGGQPNDGLAAMRQQLFQLEAKEKDLLSRKTNDHPEVTAIRSQLETLRSVFDNETPTHSSMQSAIIAVEEAEVKAIRARLDSLVQYQTELHEDLLSLNDQEIVLAQGERRVSQLESEYLANLKRREQARIDEAMQMDKISNVSVMQSPTFVPIPVAPKKKLALVAGFMLALMASCGLALLIEYFREPVIQHDPSPASEWRREPYSPVPKPEFLARQKG
ncbi:GumC family protein [Novipirellula caenicola]|uniref:Polysaccharide chain length determinant N-terminal domain-containing protein n=1 Tax=Novipirellula caenicola TaxID=1536901 RepID=A0ABP9VMY4_9BACT